MARSSRHFFGIDFGTSSCSVSYVVDDPRLRDRAIVQTVSVEFDRDGEACARMPSIVAADLDGPDSETSWRAVLGWAFGTQLLQRKRTSRLLRRGRHFLTSVKSDLGQFRVYPHSRIAGVRTPIDATRRVFEELIAATRSFRAELDLRDAPVVITVPASASALARKDLVDAAVAAGLDREKVELLDEPVAALVDLLNSPDAGALVSDKPKNVLVFDFGAGTCDLALVRVRFEDGKATGIAAQTLAISPYRRLGGDEIDRAIAREILDQAFADPAALERLSDAERRALEDTLASAVAQPLKEKLCREVDAHLKRNPADGWERLREAPITVQHSLERGFHEIRPGTRFTLSSDAFERVMAPFVAWPAPEEGSKSLMEPVHAILAKAGLRLDALDLLVLHGGSSRNPHVRRLLEQRLRDENPRLLVTTTPDMLTSVASGAAVACYWRHCRGQEFVVPVLGEELGIHTSDGAHHALVLTSTPLPHPADRDALADPMDGAARFFTPEGAVSHVLVPFFAGSGDARRIAGSVRIPIPPGTPPRSPIRIKLRLSRDKMVEWFTSMNGGPFREQESLHDPWTRQLASPDERALVEHRRKMLEASSQGWPLSQALIREEARRLWFADRLDEALACVDDALEDTCADDPWSWNLRGATLARMGNRRDAVAAYRRATELSPKVAVFACNLGWSLDQLGRTSEAEAALRHALDLDPAYDLAHERLGYIYRRRGDEPAARAEFERALSMVEKTLEATPFSQDAWQRAGSLRRSLGRYDESELAGSIAEQFDVEALIGGSQAEWIRGRAGGDGEGE